MTGVDVIEVGAELPPLAIADVSRTTLALFAGASGDHNPIHIDIDVARSAGMEDVFAPGMLSMAYLGRLITNWVPQERIRSFEVRFVSITPVHAAPTCRGEVASVETIDGQRLARLDLVVSLADGVVTLTGNAMVAID